MLSPPRKLWNIFCWKANLSKITERFTENSKDFFIEANSKQRVHSSVHVHFFWKKRFIKVQWRFCEGSVKVQRRFSEDSARFSLGSAEVQRGFSDGSAKVEQKSSKGSVKVQQRFIEGLGKVYSRFSEGSAKIQRRSQSFGLQLHCQQL